MRADRRQLAADVVAEHVSDASSERGVDYTIKVRNVGQSPAREVQLHLAERVDGLSGAVTLFTHVGTLAPGDDWEPCTLSSGGHPRRRDGLARAGIIVGYWIDGNGEHRQQ